MILNKDILVIFETSVIRNPNHPYKEVKFGSDFLSIKTHAEKNTVNNKVQIAITKFSIDELLKGREEEFTKDIKILDKFDGFQNINKNYKIVDYHEYLKGKLKAFLKNNKILLIPYPPKDRLYHIAKRSLLKQSPFIDHGKHSDYGFKDVMIWESVINFKKINNFKKVIFVCGDGGFNHDNCRAEFSKIHDCFFRITRDYKEVIREIDETIATGQPLIFPAIPNVSQNDQSPIELSDETRSLLDSEYFLDGIKRFILSNLSVEQQNQDININKTSETIEEWFIDEELAGLKINYEVKVGSNTENISVLLDDMNGITDYILSA